MRVTRILAAATLLALPLGTPAAMAAPATPGSAQAVSTIDVKAPVINVRKGGGFGAFRGGGFRGGAFRGGGFRAHSFSGPRVRSFSRGAYRSRAFGPSYAYKGGRHFGRGYGHHHRRHFRRGFVVGYPYYYYPDYYDDYYYDDDVGYSDDAVARCAARYRSFDPASGTFLGNDGERHLCPYLR